MIYIHKKKREGKQIKIFLIILSTYTCKSVIQKFSEVKVPFIN